MDEATPLWWMPEGQARAVWTSLEGKKHDKEVPGIEVEYIHMSAYCGLPGTPVLLQRCRLLVVQENLQRARQPCNAARASDRMASPQIEQQTSNTL